MSEFPKRIKVEIEYDIGEIVYLSTDEDQCKYMVMGYNVRQNTIYYEVYSVTNGTYVAYNFELSRDKTLQI